jgi:tRNA(Ile)-lysidine synthase TilS/MesJ
MPKLWQSRTEVWVIRPLVYLQEQWIKSESERLELPIIKNPCAYAGNTERENTKKLIKNLSGQIPDIRNKILRSLTKLDEKDKWKKTDWRTPKTGKDL